MPDVPRVCIRCGWLNTSGEGHKACGGVLVYTIGELRDIATNNTEAAEFLRDLYTDPNYRVLAEALQVTPIKTQEVRTTSSTGGQKGVKLERFDLIPVGPLRELAQHYGRGAEKYASHQWRQGYEWSKSYSALQRHLTAFWDGQDYDTCPSDGAGCKAVTSEGEPFAVVPGISCYNHTGSHHMVAVAWHSFTLLEFKDRFPQFDDRYKPNMETT